MVYTRVWQPCIARCQSKQTARPCCKPTTSPPNVPACAADHPPVAAGIHAKVFRQPSLAACPTLGVRWCRHDSGPDSGSTTQEATPPLGSDVHSHHRMGWHQQTQTHTLRMRVPTNHKQLISSHTWELYTSRQAQHTMLRAPAHPFRPFRHNRRLFAPGQLTRAILMTLQHPPLRHGAHAVTVRNPTQRQRADQQRAKRTS